MKNQSEVILEIASAWNDQGVPAEKIAEWLAAQPPPPAPEFPAVDQRDADQQ